MNLLIATVALTLFTSFQALAGVTFKVDVKGGIGAPFEGTVETVHGSTDAKSGDLHVLLKDFDTGWVPLRTSHLKEHMQADTYPKISVQWEDWIPTLSWSDKVIRVTIWGVTRPVRARMRREGKVIDAEFVVRLSDFGIPQPNRFGSVVQDDIHVTAWVRLK